MSQRPNDKSRADADPADQETHQIVDRIEEKVDRLLGLVTIPPAR